MNNRIDIPNWYQLDFNISDPKNTLVAISNLMTGLINQKLINKWFYLFEGSTIRVRMHTTNPQILENAITEGASKLSLIVSIYHPFERYWETMDAFDDAEAVEMFANVMSSLTLLTITRLKGKQISNYRLVERLTHCIFNNVYGSDTEVYLLLKKLGADFGNRDNPQQTVLDNNQKYEKTMPSTLSISSFTLPIK